MSLDYDAVVKHIIKESGVSIVEIARILESQGIPSKGDLMLYYPYEPVAIWASASEALMEVLQRLIADDRISVATTQSLVYLIDGQALTLPLANPKSVERQHPYKSDRWLPVVFNRK